MAKVCWPYFDPEYENFSSRINPPRVSMDNDSCHDCTLIKIDSVNKPGILLEVVQILTDLDFIITKAYISSDGGWFMDVFHVTDQQGKKITDNKIIGFIEKDLQDVIVRSKTSHTQNHGFAVVFLILRSEFMMLE
jgi:UTP:GlnB (protein PII) uridylyltransferase